MLINRLRQDLSKLVSIYQNAFMLGRLVSENILITHKVVEFIRKKKVENTHVVALKLDISKAYDRISWYFLISVLCKMDFRTLELTFSLNAYPQSLIYYSSMAYHHQFSI